MSMNDISGKNTVSPITARFPRLHIEAFGAGEVGRIYVTRSPGGVVIKAEATLTFAPFKRMLIDDPKILKIFGEYGEGIDIKLLHPAAKFRLDPLQIIEDEDGDLDMASFDIGRLVDITDLPMAAKYGWSEQYLSTADPEEEGEVHKRVRQDVELETQKKIERQGLKRKSPSTQPPLTQTRHQRQKAAKEEAKKEGLVRSRQAYGTIKKAAQAGIKLQSVSISPASRLRAIIKVKKPEIRKDTVYSGLPSLDSEHSSVASKRLPKTSTTLPPPRKGRNTGPIPNTAQGQKMGVIFKEITAKLSDSDRATYTDMVTIDRRIAAKSDASRRAFAARVQAFVENYEVVGLHNAYAELLKRSGSNKAYQLPTFEIHDGGESEQMNVYEDPEPEKQEIDDSLIGKVAAYGNPNAMFE